MKGRRESGFLKLALRTSVMPIRLATMEKGPTTLPMMATWSPNSAFKRATARMSSGTRPRERKSAG